jgi:hypothetical protein
MVFVSVWACVGDVGSQMLRFGRGQFVLASDARMVNDAKHQPPPLLAGEGWGGVGHLPETFPQVLYPLPTSPCMRPEGSPVGQGEGPKPR